MATRSTPWMLGAALAACTSGPPPSGEVTVVTETRGGSPLANQTIVFHGADGRVFDMDVTGRDGRLTGPMEPGGMVTWYAGILNGKHRLFTETQVPLDEDLVLLTGQGPPIDHALAIQLPRPPVDARNVHLWSGCAETDVDAPIRKATLLMTVECPGPGTTVLAYAYGESGNPVAYALAEHRDPDIDGLMIHEWKELPQLTRVSLAHPPTAILRASAWIAPSLNQRMFGRHALSLPSGPQPSARFGRPPGFGDELLVGVSTVHLNEVSLVQHVVSATTTEKVFDGVTELLPRVHAVRFDEEDGVRVSWSPEAGLEDQADIVDLEVAWPRGHWFFVAPKATSVVLPDLPSSLEATPADEMGAAVGYSDYLTVDDYRTVRTAIGLDVRQWRASYAYSPDAL